MNYKSESVRLLSEQKSKFKKEYPLLARLLSGNGQIVYYVEDLDVVEGTVYQSVRHITNFYGLFGFDCRICYMHDLYLHGKPKEEGFNSCDDMEAYLKNLCVDRYGDHYNQVLQTSSCLFECL